MRPPLPRSLEPELLDDKNKNMSSPDLEANLSDLGFVNRCAGGNHSILFPLRRHLREWNRERVLRVLEVGLGGGDLTRALARRCRAHGIRARIVGLDHNPKVLRFARRRLGGYIDVTLVGGDALSLPFPSASFDFVLSSLVLHHLHPAQGVPFLRELARVSRRGILVSDLRRGRWEYYCTLLFSRLFFKCRMTRHDAPLSVLRSLTLEEAEKLVAEAGWERPGVRKSFPLRLLLVERLQA